MKFVVTKIVEAKNAIEALKKAKQIPVTEVYIHAPSWERDNFGLDKKNNNKIGFKNAS